jgi:branched-chain amino acid transport system substrate-binding protein
MTRLRATLVTPLSGPLVRFGRESATALSLWAEHAAVLPQPWTGVDLEVLDANPDPGAAMRAAVETRPEVLFGSYGSSPMVAAARVTNRAIWNHGGATSALSRPGFPHVINVLSPASSYFAGVLKAVRALDPDAAAVSVLHRSSGFGRDVASGAVSAAGALGFRVRAVPFAPGHAAEVATTLPDADVLLVVGDFEDEVAAARVLLPGGWRAAAFVGAGVEEVLAPLGDLREGLLGPAQWIAAAAPEPDEGPDAGWFVDEFRRITGSDPSYPAAQAFAAGVLCTRCLRDGGADDEAQLAAAHQLECTTLYGGFRLDPVSGLQVGHEVLVVQWQDDVRRVVWPPGRAESSLGYPLGD